MNNKSFQRVLVANRGEIAVRVIRGCRDRGIETVAVFSDADVNALHVRLADQAVHVGGSPSSESYLVAERILAAAKSTGSDAIHPGYGFLSENADFADAVIAAGMVWIGPPPSAIRQMGSKTGARQTMESAGVPCVPGTLEALSDGHAAIPVAKEIGYPVMLKAVAGGGGKGMRRVDSEEDLLNAWESAQSESIKSFSDDQIYIEKLIVDPRHVEIQVLADAHGNVVHLFERDCSVQRRHQKVIEETPCPVLADDIRSQMGEVAVRAAKAVNYQGAGTCEFLLSGDERSFYFLEMNTRLQVEHPITEMVTGIDLVQAQLRIAAGEPLWFSQEDLVQSGHAIECRIYAENVAENFRPSPGLLTGYREPSGPWIRVDSGIEEGAEVPIYYDPMISKLVVWGRDRDEAIRRTRQALLNYEIVGIPTSIPFFLHILDDPDFLSGRYTTGFITPERLDAMDVTVKHHENVAIAAAIVRFEADNRTAPTSKQTASAWKWSHRTGGRR